MTASQVRNVFWFAVRLLPGLVIGVGDALATLTP